MAINLKKTRAQNIFVSDKDCYYFRGRFGGKQITRSLATNDFAQARIRAVTVRTEETQAAVARKTSGFARALPWTDCVGIWLRRQDSRQHDLRAATLKYWQYISRDVLAVMPGKTKPGAITYDMLLQWWSAYACGIGMSRANNTLCAVKSVLEIQVEMGMRYDNPALRLKRISRPKTELIVPTREQFRKIIAHVREQAAKKYPGDYLGSRLSPSADFLEFLAYSGCRLAEAQNLTWEDVGDGFIRVRAGKGGKSRRVDMTDDLKSLLNRLRGQFEGFVLVGPIFAIKAPRAALSCACRRLSLPHLRLHDLRHFFATNAIESGIDIATVAKWLGHADGGVLALSVYGHVRDDHSRASAARVRGISDSGIKSIAAQVALELSASERGVAPAGISPAPPSCVRGGAEPPREQKTLVRRRRGGKGQGIFSVSSPHAVLGAGGERDVCSFEIMGGSGDSLSCADGSFSVGYVPLGGGVRKTGRKERGAG